ncbi:alpha/beta hydrolase [Luteibacter aegosomatis]|uniref:alpha/beta fold hydrolase n=1 Tax=Luteibacter aegosomatis TaxID=2911537 RepID=UPI001FF87591|nr:alpha/beta hydrolase [Luteibacter aegosomatis]UPG85201.1 alpha/beta hydrolase [Luteibacter aegosomatis]
MKVLTETHRASTSHLGYVRHGIGPIHVLVMHDWLGDHSNYDEIVPWLDTQTLTYVFVDLRGYGLSIDLEGDYTVEEIAADCLTLADRLGWDCFHVIGHSMTGMISQRLVADAPSRVVSAIAVCPISAAGNRLGPEALAFFASTVDDDAALGRLFKFVSGGLSDEWVESKVRHNRGVVAPACRARYLDMLVTADFVDDVRGLETPFLVIVGSEDPGLDEAAMKRTFLSWHPNAELHVMADCGHYPMQVAPARFAALIESYLNRQVVRA